MNRGNHKDGSIRHSSQSKQRSRGRNNRRGTNPLQRNYESNGPDVKIRGSATQVAEKYMALARDAQVSSDHILAENYMQHAEHYFRIIAAAQSNHQSIPSHNNIMSHNKNVSTNAADLNKPNDELSQTATISVPSGSMAITDKDQLNGHHQNHIENGNNNNGTIQLLIDDITHHKSYDGTANIKNVKKANNIQTIANTQADASNPKSVPITISHSQEIGTNDPSDNKTSVKPRTRRTKTAS